MHSIVHGVTHVTLEAEVAECQRRRPAALLAAAGAGPLLSLLRARFSRGSDLWQALRYEPPNEATMESEA